MRILFAFAGGTGHFLPLVPLARSAARAGHVVAFAGQAGMVATVEAAGFTAFDTAGASLLAAGKRMPLLELDDEREARAIRDGYAGRIARERAAALLPLYEEWQPDVVVCDELDFAAMVVAERLAVPYATVSCLAAGSMVTPELVAAPLDDLRAAHGLPPDPGLTMPERYLVLSPVPPSFRDPSSPVPATAHPLRPVGPESAGGEAAPGWLAEPRQAPIVYLTLGTIFNLESGDLFERALAGLRALPVDVVVTVGRELDPAELGPQPPNVRVEQYIPQSLLLPRCSLVVSHGGSGSVIGALGHGLPMVLLPIGADQPLNAARCAALGVARVLDALRATPESVREAAREVLASSVYRQNAERVCEEAAALPGPEHAVTLLERLTAERRPLVRA